MSDDFGTVSAKKGDRARELARLREHYRNHRETLTGLMGDAPSEHLANEYQRLIADIDTAVRKIDELEGKGLPPATPAPVAGMVDTNPVIRPSTRPGATAPGNRPLVRPSEPMATAPVSNRNPRAVIIMMVIAALVVLGAIAYLVWRPRTNPRPIVEQPVTTATSQVTETTATAPPTIPGASMKITPALADYGTIRKGTRAVRQFEVTNTSGGPIEIQVARSECKCLFYDYKSKLAPNAKETVTVTIDGARAKPGPLQEQVTVTAKGQPSVSATFTVQATIR